MVRILAGLLGVHERWLRERRYRVDRWATNVALVLMLLAVPVTGALGVARYEAEALAALEKSVNGYKTVAVIMEHPSARETPPGAYGFPVQVLATWRTPDGRQHEGRIPADPELTAGSEVPLWVDADGQPTAAPRSQGEIITTAVATSVWNLVLMELAVIGGYWLFRWLMDRFRMASLGAEWARVEPWWSQRQ